MALVVRLVRGEWKKDKDGLYEHVAELEGFCLAVRVREQDDYRTVVSAVKQRLSIPEDKKIELTYQWPQWMMGPKWKRANPIHIENDEDMSLFMAIRADLEEVHLRVRVIKGDKEDTGPANMNVPSNEDMSAAGISDQFWNTAGNMAIWDSAITRMLWRTGNDIPARDTNVATPETRMITGNETAVHAQHAGHGDLGAQKRQKGIRIIENNNQQTQPAVHVTAQRTIEEGSGKSQLLPRQRAKPLPKKANKRLVKKKTGNTLNLISLENDTLRICGETCGQEK